MHFREGSLFTEAQRLTAEKLFGIRVCGEHTPVVFDDGVHDVAALTVMHWEPTGLGIHLLQEDWVTKDRCSLAPNDAKLVWRDTTGWRIKHIPHICKTTIEARGLSDDDVVILTSSPDQEVYLFFKNTTSGHISLVHPFAQFAVSAAHFTPEGLASLRARPSLSDPACDYERFKTLFDSVRQAYTIAVFTDLENATQTRATPGVMGIALLRQDTLPQASQLSDDYTTVFYFDGNGKYLGPGFLPR